MVNSSLSISFDGNQRIIKETKKELTAQKIYHITIPTVRNIQFSPDGKKIYFLKNDYTKKLGLWEFSLLTKKSTPLAISEERDILSKEEKHTRERQREKSRGIVKYELSHDGKKIIYPFKGKIYCLSLGKKKKIDTILENPSYDPKLSPKSHYVSFVRNKNLFILDRKKEREIQLTFDGNDTISNGIADFIAQEELDRYTGYWWSPNENYIAFTQVDESPVQVLMRVDFDNHFKIVNQSYPKAGTHNVTTKLGIITIPEGEIQWIKLPEEHDFYLARVDWLPNSKQVSFQILSRNHKRLYLYLADIKTGESRVIHKESTETWINLHNDLYFFESSNCLVWSSEYTGYKHLYLFNRDTNEMRALTQGSWNVDQLVGVKEKKYVFYFTGFKKSTIEKHLYHTTVNPSCVKQVTGRRGWHEITMNKKCSFYVDNYSNAKENPIAIVKSIYSSLRENLSEYQVKIDVYSPPKFGTIEGKFPLNYSIVKPQNFDSEKKYPVIIYVYGGPSHRLVKNQWGGILGMWEQLMAQKGYVVFKLDNRGTSDRGKAFEAGIYRQLGKVEVEDQVKGVEFLRTLPYVDSNKIGVFGHSYGGYMTLMMMMKRPDIFRFGVSSSPVTDWSQYDTCYTERYLGKPEDNPEGYRKSSILENINDQMGKLLLIHGMADDNVFFTNTGILIKQLQDKMIQFETMVYPGSKHSLNRRETGIHYYNCVNNFFDRYLKKDDQ